MLQRQGLETKSETYLQFKLLHGSIKMSMGVASCCLLSNEWQARKYATIDTRVDVALAHVPSAFSDCKTYLELSPPDNRHFLEVIYIYLALAPVIYGLKGLSPDLHELKAAPETLTIVEKSTGTCTARTNLG